MKIKTIKNLKNLQGKTVFLRVDYNVSISNGKILDDYRLRASLPTIELLLKRGAKIILASHLGDPQGLKSGDYSLKPIASRLSKFLKKPVKFINNLEFETIYKTVSNLNNGGIILLENLRFEPGELTNEIKFAKKLASLADIYVNDAFAVSHRQQASVSAIKKYLPAYAGLLVEAEVKSLNKVLKPRRPLVVIMGGAKISTKAPLIRNFYNQASAILVGGALANNFFKYQGWEIGRSLFDHDSEQEIRRFFNGRRVKSKIILPLDVVVKNIKSKIRACSLAEVKRNDTILDIGPKTISLFAAEINKAQTLVWNGPMGKFEETIFKQGTLSIARLVASRSSGRAYGLIGGGETVAALKMSKMYEYVDWVSTAGGAMLAYLGGEKMPGLKGIIS